MRKLIAVLLPLLWTISAPAQAAAPPVQDWSNAEVESVTVNAARDEPLLWHVKQGSADLWILGTVYPIPKDFDWNREGVKRVLDGARQVYLPPKMEIGLLSAGWFLLTQRHTLKQPDGVTLDGTLTPDLLQRLSAWRRRIKLDADQDFLAAVAAVDFELTFHRRAHLNGTTLDHVIERMADDAGVPTKPVNTFAAMPVLKEVTRLPREGQNICMKDALDDMDAQSEHAEAAARAWAGGDLAGIQAHYSEARLFDCFDQSKTAAAYRAQWVTSALNLAKASLEKDGKTLMVLPMGIVLRQNGLIDGLRAAGFTVTASKD